MDYTLLTFFNQTLVHPALDSFMIAVTTVGLAVVPAVGITLALSQRYRRAGVAILASIIAGLILAVTFQYLAFRPRPEAARLLLPTPDFPSFPSGHATVAFAGAMVVGLTFREWRWWLAAITGAMLISISRVYLGHHYPSDVFGGAVLGATVGAACYGLIVLPRPDWRWLLWPQIALVIVISQMAYLGRLPWYLFQWPMADKVIHFLLFGAVVFWLNLWINGRNVQVGGWFIPLAILAPMVLATVEEGYQAFSPIRSSDLLDLTSDLLGMLFFFWLSTKFIRTNFERYPLPSGHEKH